MTVAEEMYDSGDEEDEFYDRTRAKKRSREEEEAAKRRQVRDTRLTIRDTGAADGFKQAPKVQTTQTLMKRSEELEKEKEDVLFELHQAKAASDLARSLLACPVTFSYTCLLVAS